MKIIVGLGNKGREYLKTRHNVGFILLEKLAYKYGCDFSFNKKFNAEICKIKNDVILVKPQTFMNKSGESVSKILSFYKDSTVDDLLVVHDDVDLDFGQIKIQKGISSAGHRGVQNIIDVLNTNDFIRFRVGVGRPENPNLSTDDWVLSKFTDEQLNEVENTIYQYFLEKIDE